jgi:hypothetical protein
MSAITTPATRTAALLLTGLFLALSGCKSPIAQQDLRTMDQLLRPAGFVRRDADTPERRAHIETLEQKTLVGRAEAGGTTWLYADAKDCRCLYVGRDQQYANLQALLAGEEKAQDIAAATHPAPDAPTGDDQTTDGGIWDLWGPWDDVPWYNELTY